MYCTVSNFWMGPLSLKMRKHSLSKTNVVFSQNFRYIQQFVLILKTVVLNPLENNI